QSVYDQGKRTAGQAKLVNGGDGGENVEPGSSFIFPIPKTGGAVILNHMTRYRLNVHGWYMQAMPQAHASYTPIKIEEEAGDLEPHDPLPSERASLVHAGHAADQRFLHPDQDGRGSRLSEPDARHRSVHHAQQPAVLQTAGERPGPSGG